MAREKTLNDISEQLSEDAKVQQTTDKNIEKMAKNMDAFLKVMATNKQRGREGELEKPRAKPAKDGLMGKLKDNDITNSILAFGKKFGVLIAGLAGTVLALFSETFNDIARTVAAVFFNPFKKVLVSLFKGLRFIATQGFDSVKVFFSKSFDITKKGFIKAIDSFFDAFGRSVNVFDDTAKRWRNMNFGRFTQTPALMTRAIDTIIDSTRAFANTLEGIFLNEGNPFTRIREILTNRFESLKVTFQNIFGEGSGFAKMIEKVKTAFNFAEDSPIMKIVGKAQSVMKALAPALKVIFKPIGIILTLVDVVKGAIEGYGGSVNPETGEIEGDGIFGAVVGAVTGLLKSIVGAPANLLKSISLWIGKKLGVLSEEDADKIDKEWDFEKIIKDMGDAFARLIGRAVEWLTNFDIGQSISDGWEALKSKFMSSADKEPTVSPEDIMVEPVEGQRALGGSIFGGKTFLVGEKGPEFVKMTQGMTGNVVPNNQMGSTLGNLMKAAGPMAQFGNQKGKELKAKEDAMRAAGASDMEIAQSMMGDMGGMMGGLKGAISAGGLDKLKMPKMDMGGVKEMFKPQNIGNAFGAMVNESEAAKREQAAKQPAPVIVNSDNSVRSGGTSNTAMPVQSQPFDFNDPFVKGMRMA